MEGDRAARGGVFRPEFEVAEGTESNRFRTARFRRFRALLESLPAKADGAPIRILDVGGAPGYWLGVRPLWQDFPVEITIVNIGAEDEDRPPFHLRKGDACSLPYADRSYDIVHSNSVIEHVGQWRAMRAMAHEVRRLAPRYFVQTPNFWFPYEPHYKMPFIHWLPESVRAAMVLRKARGWISADTYDQAMTEVQDINLVTARQMAELFPDAVIEREYIGPFTKSLIAIR